MLSIIEYRALLIIFVLGLSVVYVDGQVSIRDQIEDAYKAVAVAYDRGGNATSLITELNSIIYIVESGDFNQVEVSNSLNSIIMDADILAMTSEQENTMRLAIITFNLVIVIVIGYIIWRYFPKYYWRTWLRFRGHWIVE